MHVVPICLSDDDNLLVGEKAWVKGFGRIGASKYLFTISNYGHTLITVAWFAYF